LILLARFIQKFLPRFDEGMLSSEPSIMITPLNGALDKIKSEFDSLVKQEEQDKLEEDSDTLLSRYFYFHFCW
jgi:hypothetical protein